MSHLPPVITIDGLGSSGKGTIGQLLAQYLHWHFLDSGSLYRALAYVAQKNGISLDNEAKLAEIAANLPVKFAIDENSKQAPVILIDNQDVSADIRAEACGNAASEISSLPKVRQALVAGQRVFRQLPGLVTDGRDMGTVIFPDATLKIFLTATAQVRAQRRYEQLLQRGIHANLHDILADLVERDARDSNRGIAPTKPAEDAIVLDTSHLSVDEVLTQIVACYERRLLH